MSLVRLLFSTKLSLTIYFAIEREFSLTIWHIVTGEYPPQPGGVSDYTRLVAQGLAGTGDEVHVWSPKCQERTPEDAGVIVHRLPDHFGPRALSALNSYLNRLPKPCRLLVQYVPHAFGWKAMNLPFCLWLHSRRRRDSIWTLFHEVAYPLAPNQTLAQNMLGVVTRQMASIVARAAERVFVSIPAWERTLRTLVPGLNSITWLPVPSNIPVINDPIGVKAVRTRYASAKDFVLGHFGTYGRHITELLLTILPPLLRGFSERVMLLLGSGGKDVRDELLRSHPGLKGNVHATGELAMDALSRHLNACDMMIQPYADGISSRRTSAMASLQHGVPIISTSGQLTEPLWAESGAVALVQVENINAMVDAVNHLQENKGERTRISMAAQTLYKERFDINHLITTLHEPADFNTQRW